MNILCILHNRSTKEWVTRPPSLQDELFGNYFSIKCNLSNGSENLGWQFIVSQGTLETNVQRSSTKPFEKVRNKTERKIIKITQVSRMETEEMWYITKNYGL